MWIINKVLELLKHKPMITYAMGADNIEGPTPKLDCSAFLWRGLGERKFDGKYWRNTSWLWNDIENENTKFDIVFDLKDIKQGDVVVYRGSNGRAGHCAIINTYDGKKLIGYDCSSTKNCIAMRDISFFFKKDYRVGRYIG